MQIIPLKKFNIQTCFFQFLWFFRLKCWFKGQIISRIHLSLPNAYKLMCFDRNINWNRDVKFLECDYFLVQRCVKLTLVFKFNLGLLNKYKLMHFDRNINWNKDEKILGGNYRVLCTEQRISHYCSKIIGKKIKGNTDLSNKCKKPL